jgi:Leucine-rich repeat (LRR) protein
LEKGFYLPDKLFRVFYGVTFLALARAMQQRLTEFSVDNNALKALVIERTMPKLRILRLSGNKLTELSVARVPNLRTLYVDHNSVGAIGKVERLTRLENLSMRSQGGRNL